MGRMSGPQKNENDKLVELVHRVKTGNDESAFEQIAGILHTYLRHLSLKKFRIAGNNSDDVYQEGLYALSTKAIPDYREEKGAFLSFAKLCIRRHIITVLKSANNNKNRALNGSVSLDSPACDDDDDGPIPVSGFLPNGDPDITEVFSRNEVHSNTKLVLVSKLTDLERHVLDCYLQNMSYLDIVQSMNKYRRGRNRVNCKVIDNALCRIKKKAIEIEEEIRNSRPALADDNDDG